MTDVAIEYGHFDTRLGAPDLPQQALDAANLARYLRAGLVAAGLDVQTQVLIDDKKDEFHELKMLSQTARDLLDRVDATCSVDLVTFESSFKQFRHSLLELLPDDRSKTLARQMDEFIDQTDMLACSHDIGIWHALRLGVIGEPNIPAWTPRNAAAKLVSAQWAVSILGHNHRSQERSAQQRILRYITTNQGVRCSDRTLRIYVGADRRRVSQVLMKILDSEGVADDNRSSPASNHGS